MEKGFKKQLLENIYKKSFEICELSNMFYDIIKFLISSDQFCVIMGLTIKRPIM